jgi:hypothetical protein
MKTNKGKRGISKLILNLGVRLKLDVNFMPQQLDPGEKPQYSLSRWLGGIHTQSGRFGEDKNLLPLPGFEPWIVQSIATQLH